VGTKKFLQCAIMHSIEKQVLIWYSAEAMFDLVADVRAYPQFLPWCASAVVQDESAEGMRASLGIDHLGVRQSFTTQNRHYVEGKLRRVTLELIDGPFSQLHGEWRFTPIKAGSCKVDLRLSYAFANPILERLIGPVFETIASTFIDAFVKRAEAVYG
jgi:ribosome-associated toxin RatA of RatAB toxin-antitoxin module